MLIENVDTAMLQAKEDPALERDADVCDAMNIVMWMLAGGVLRRVGYS